LPTKSNICHLSVINDFPAQTDPPRETGTRELNGSHLKSWEEKEKSVIEEALLSQEGHRTKTAKSLGISHPAL